MRSFTSAFAVLFLSILGGCTGSDFGASRGPLHKEARINGVVTNYVEQGRGSVVVFVHGAFLDYRFWESQREAVSRSNRFIAVDLRYFGKAPWPDAGAQYSLATHAEDLAAFIRSLDAGPVHLVATSYGGSVALVVATRNPQLVRTLFINENAIPTMITEAAQQQAIAADRKELGAAVAAAKANESLRSAQIFLDWATLRPNAYERLSADRQAVIRENARTMPLLFAAPPPVLVTCAQLTQLRIPVTITMGHNTRPAARIVAESTHRCISGSQLKTISNATHTAPWENSSEFNAELMAFLSRNR